ncbi:MAG: ethanolamine ammonia-lyase, partial [Candidatus Nanopelagicales bacterium]
MMANVSATEVRAVVQAVLSELGTDRSAVVPAPAAPPPAPPEPLPPRPAPMTGPTRSTTTAKSGSGTDIDVADPTVPSARHIAGIREPINPSGLDNLMASTTARIG